MMADDLPPWYVPLDARRDLWLLVGARTPVVEPGVEATAGSLMVVTRDGRTQLYAKQSGGVTDWSSLTGAPVFDVRSYGAMGDGHTDDRAAVQSAAAAANAGGGGTVFFGAGRFLIAGPGADDYLRLTTPLSNVTFLGDPGAELVVPSATTRYVLLMQHARRVAMVGLRWRYLNRPARRTDGGPKGVRITHSSDILLHRCQLDGSPQYGIAIENSSRARVVECEVHDTMADGISLNSCFDSVIVGNAVSHTGDDGIAISTPRAAVPGERGEGSVITRNTVRYSAGRGIIVQGDGVIVSANMISDTAGASIHVLCDWAAQDPGLASRGIVLTGNHCRRARMAVRGTGPGGSDPIRHGATAGGAIAVTEVTATGFVRRTPHSGIGIHGNIVDECEQCGIYCASVDGLAITGNMVLRYALATESAFLAGIRATDVTAATVAANVVVPFGDPEKAIAIDVRGASGIVVQANATTGAVVGP